MKEINKINQEQTIAIVQIRKDIEFIKGEISNIKDNHLAKIYTKLDNQKSWLIGILGSLIILLIGTILNLLK